MTRREALQAAAGGALGFAAAGGWIIGAAPGRAEQRAFLALKPAPDIATHPLREITLRAKERLGRLPVFGGRELPMWTYGDGWPLVVRARVGEHLSATVINELPQTDASPARHTDVHWHGIRNVNSMDGVSFLTQQPIAPGASFTYEFPLLDTGTFFFHGHCDTVTSFGRGLLGVLIVEGDETEPFDAEVVLVSKDWRLSEAGEFLPFTTDEGASKAGTFGTRRSVNGAENPVYDVPAGADVRVRFLQVDPARIVEFGLKGAVASIIAVDGHGVAPFALTSWRMGPAMRIDLVVRTPADGQEVVLYDYFSAQPIPLARLRSRGPVKRKGPFNPAPLYAPRFVEPDASAAIPLSIALSATAVPDDVALPNGEVLRIADSLCLNGKTFWALNKQSWPERDMKRLPAPLATLERGKTYRLTLHNATPHMHPIHIHGLVFKYLSSNKRERSQHWADTVLVLPKERLDVLLLADNPGDWMFHCHILEHQETGMMGYIRVV